MRVYISGPITNTPDHRDRFAAAVEYFGTLNPELTPIEALVNPLDVKACEGGKCGWYDSGSDENDGGNGHTWACWMEYDLMALEKCDTIALIPGWHRSKGAKLELKAALDLDFQVLVLRSVLMRSNGMPVQYTI